MPMPQDIAAHIDHTVLAAEAGLADIDRAVAEARQYGFAAVCVNPIYIRRVSQALEGTPIKACTVVGFPLGASMAMTKAREAVSAMEEGADEIDIVAHLPHLLDADERAIHGELVEVVTTAQYERTDVTIKVIVESALLLKDVDERTGEARIAAACRAIRDAGCDYIKTSTGFHPAGGACEHAVKLMRKHGQGLKIKASGGIRTLDQALRLLTAGADRLGCSRSVELIEQAVAAARSS